VLFRSDVIGLTEVFLATVLIISLILKPEGIMAGRELRWRPKAGRHEVELQGAAPAKRE
jgi:hypothetical protein